MTGASQRGTVTIWVALLAAFVLSGLLVMSVDVGRFYLIQGELQTAADSAALAAATQLAGAAGSDANAGNQMAAAFDFSDNNDNRFNLRQNQFGVGNFNGNLITNMAVDYFQFLQDALSNSGGGQTGASARFVRVQMTAQSPVLFTRILDPNFQTGPSIVATAVAGLSSPICTACGIGVLAVVDQSSGSDPVNFGLTQGGFYTLFLDTSQQSAPIGPTCTTSTPADITTLDNPTLIGNGVVNYVILDHAPSGGVNSDGDGTLFELTAAGMESSDSDTIGTPGTAAVAGTAGLPEAIFGTYTAVTPTTASPGQDIICGLNTRFFGTDTTQATPCDTLDGAEFVSLAAAYAYSADADQGNAGTYAAGGNGFLQDFGTEYYGNDRRVITLPVVDDVIDLDVLGFRQFLVETDPAASSGAGLNPAATGARCQTGAFPAEYIGWPVPLQCGGVGGACSVSYGVGRTVLH